MVAVSDALRQELAATVIGVSALCPGGVRTNLIEADRNGVIATISTGAPGSEHHPLGATSSASDAGEASLCSADDQLLVPRATCSIGSVEP